MEMLLLLLLLLLPAGTEAESGDQEADMEPRISCSSHITTTECSLTCKLLGGSSDDEDAEDDEDGIESMSLCDSNWLDGEGFRCLQGLGHTINSKSLRPLQKLNLTIHLRRGGNVSTTVELTKIVKPRSPQVWNVTFDQELNQAVINFWTPDDKGYLRVDNQVFQLHICTAGSDTIQNVSSKDFLLIDMGHLRKHTEYHVKVRAIPQRFQGSWSEWSETFSFFTPAEKKLPDQTYKLIVCLVSVLVVTSSVVICWKIKIFTYMWPSIPHPKQTLVQICKPNKGLLLNFKPEVFSALRVYPLEKPACEEAEPSISPASAAADSVQSSNPSSTQSSNQSSNQSSTQNSTQSSTQNSTQSSVCRSTTSVSTEELELSALLSSSSGEDSLQSSSPSPINVPQPMERPWSPELDRITAGHEVEVFGASQQEEAYVTMSSFYQLK